MAVLIGWFALQRVGAQALAEDVSEHLLDETPLLLKNETLSTISPWAKLLERSDLVKIIHRHLVQSGLGWSVGRITLFMLLTASLAAAIAMQFDWIPGWGVMLVSWGVALANLGERMPLLEVSMFASAIQLQNRTGGKLNEVLAKMAEDMREATALKGEVRSLAAHGKLTGAVLTMLPLVISGIMMVVNPSYMAVLIYHPYGKYLIAGAVICLVLAHFVIRRLVDIRL